MNKVIFWDFDGTLAYMPKMFSSSLKAVLDEHEKDRQISAEDFLQYLQGGFPWQEPDKEYLHLRDTEVWWENICKIFVNAYKMIGVDAEKACKYALETRKHIANPAYYSLFNDTLDTLKLFKGNGYNNIILSNHIPELPEIAENLGLMEYVDICITSAKVGYEKPNPKIFLHAVELAGKPREAWMVGDNLKADVRGAEAVGIKAVLVRKPADEPVEYYSPDLKGTLKLIVSGICI